MFMNDVMEEKCLQECEINYSFQIESSLNLENEKKKWKKWKKLHAQKQISKSHGRIFLCWNFILSKLFSSIVELIEIDAKLEKNWKNFWEE